MAKARDTSKFEERLQQLKTEEKLIRSILEDVRKQLDRYEVSFIQYLLKFFYFSLMVCLF